MKNELGKLPPQAIELEEAILGAVMIEKEAFELISDFLKPECFYKVSHQKIFSAITTLANNNEPIDMHTVIDQLRKSGSIDEVGGPYYISLLTTKLTSAAHLVYHAEIVYQKFIGRELIRFSTKIQNMAYDEQVDVDEIISYANTNLSLINNNSGGTIMEMKEAIDLVIKNIELNSAETSISSGSLIGFDEYDKRSGGFQKTDLIIIAAESSQGKTSLALTISKNIATGKGKLAIYSMEMRAVQLAARLTSMESGIPANDILYSKFDSGMYQKLDFSIGRLINSDIYIDEKSTTNLDTIIASIRSMVKNYGIQGAVVDYIQLIQVNEKGMNREQQTGLIARKLKNLAKDLDIWIVALSQLSRDNLNPVPSIKRLRDSGQIEEACDVCMLIYRPEQIGRSSFPEPFDNENVTGLAMIDVAKGRNIGTFKFIARFDNQTTHFSPFRGESFNHNIVVREKDFTNNPF